TRWTAVFLGVLLFAAVVGSWLAVVEGQEPGFLRYALVDETFLRFTSVARFHRGAPIFSYLLPIAWGLGPWCFVLVATAPELVRLSRSRTREAEAVRFAARVAATILIFFAMSASKRPQYLLPALVPLAILCALGIASAPVRAAGSLRLLGA